MHSDQVREITASEFQAEVLSSELPVVVDFYSTECPPCEALAPKFDSLAELYGHHVRFLKIFRQGNRELADQLNVRSSPTLLFFNGGQEGPERLTGAVKRAAMVKALERLVPEEISAELQSSLRPTMTETDLLILGAGPAGLTAGIYAAQAKLKVIAVDLALGGGNVATTHQVSNFPGFPKPQPGYLLAHHLVEHAKAAGVETRFAADVTGLDLDALTVTLDGLETIRTKKLLIATGSSPRIIGVRGEEQYKGRGISYCATCDAKYYEGKHVIVIGGGNSAIEEALFISKFASKITVVHQLAELQANKVAQEQAFADPKIEFVFEHEPREFIHDGTTVSRVLVEDLKTHEMKELSCDGVFIFAGMKPNLDLVAGRLKLDRFGYVEVDPEMRTSIANVFAAGDVATKRLRQITTAVADGTIAAVAVARELSS